MVTGTITRLLGFIITFRNCDFAKKSYPFSHGEEQRRHEFVVLIL